MKKQVCKSCGTIFVGPWTKRAEAIRRKARIAQMKEDVREAVEAANLGALMPSFLRDMFAAFAVSGCADMFGMKYFPAKHFKKTVSNAYRFADLMMQARKKKARR